MAHISKSILIEAPVNEVFEFASDWQKWEGWFEGVSGFRPLTEKEKGNGTRYAYRARMMGISMPVQAEISGFRTNHGWSSKGIRGMPYTNKWIFREAGNHTRFTYEMDYHVPIPIVGRWLDRKFLLPEWHRILDRSLTNLKRQFER